MRIEFLTLFPEVIEPYLAASIPGRARQSGRVGFAVHNIRDWTQDRHGRVDDYPFGGGAGMVMSPQPLFDSIDAVRSAMPEGTQVVCLSPGGALFTNRMARELAALPGLLLLCGHYEGIDQRVIDCRVDREISIGDYVLTGGELAALVVADAAMRFLPGVVGNQDVHAEESFEQGLLEYPQYTRPADFRGLPVPEVLLGGHHARIAAWRREQSLLKTARVRPDLIEKAALTEEEKERIGGNFA
jgi:tRNA (guanine37-N1)-methyltransferase